MMASPMPPPTDTTQNSGSNKNSTTASAAMRPPEQGLKCPRCDSPNTKFCYYNNYSLTQPRHFCKTCRRYWTKGGALRNVPVGGGCRKSKKSRSSASSSSGSLCTSSSSSHLLPIDPIANFQLGMLPCRVGFTYPIPGGGVLHDEMFSFPADRVMTNGSNHHSSIASSIESLSSINQDLHWKLQQQRLAMLFGGEAQEKGGTSPFMENQVEPICFQMAAESSKGEFCGSRKGFGSVSEKDTATAWFLPSSYDTPNGNTSHTANITNNDGMNISNGNSNTEDQWNGIPTWSDMQQFSALP